MIEDKFNRFKKKLMEKEQNSKVYSDREKYIRKLVNQLNFVKLKIGSLFDASGLDSTDFSKDISLENEDYENYTIERGRI